MPKKTNTNSKTQELRLLHMSIAALRQNINTELDGLQAKIEILLPQQQNRNLTTKEMRERIMRL